MKCSSVCLPIFISYLVFVEQILNKLSTYFSFVFQAIDLALNGKRHEFIELGFQEGGLCSLYGIKKVGFLKKIQLIGILIIYCEEN